MPSRQRIAELQADLLCDDILYEERMLSWSEEDLITFFESGGTVVPADKTATSSPIESHGDEISGLDAKLKALGLGSTAVDGIVTAAPELRAMVASKDSKGLLSRLKTLGVPQLGLRQKVIMYIGEDNGHAPSAAVLEDGAVCGPEGCTRPAPRRLDPVQPTPDCATSAPAAAASTSAATPSPTAPPSAPTPASGPLSAAPAAPSPEKSVLRVRCGAVELKLTLNARLLSKPFAVAVIEPFLKALNKKQGETGAFPIERRHVLGALVEGDRVETAAFDHRSATDVLAGREAARVDVLVPKEMLPVAAPRPPTAAATAVAIAGGAKGAAATPAMLSLPPPPPPALTEPVLSAARLRQATATPEALRAHLSLMSLQDLKQCFQRHLMRPPVGALDKAELVAALVAAPRAAVEIEVVSDVV
jgi:hypothetical protein